MITDIARGEADLDTLKAGASLIPVAKITKVPKVVKAIGNVGKTGFKKGREGDKTVWKRFTREDQPKPDKNKGNQSKAGSKNGITTSKPNQVHHYATNKNKTYTPQFEEIANKYGLNLDSEWNKDLLPHQGRHPNVYHDYVLDSMKQFDEIAQGNRDVFLKLYENMKRNVQANPDMLYKNYWNR